MKNEDPFYLIRNTLNKINDLLEELSCDAEKWREYEIQVSTQRSNAAKSRWVKYRANKSEGSENV